MASDRTADASWRTFTRYIISTHITIVLLSAMLCAINVYIKIQNAFPIYIAIKNTGLTNCMQVLIHEEIISNIGLWLLQIYNWYL